MSTFNAKNIKFQHYYYNKYSTTIRTWFMCGFIPKKNIHMWTSGSICVTKEAKNVITHVSDL